MSRNPNSELQQHDSVEEVVLPIVPIVQPLDGPKSDTTDEHREYSSGSRAGRRGLL